MSKSHVNCHLLWWSWDHSHQFFSGAWKKSLVGKCENPGMLKHGLLDWFWDLY